jgi:glycosyltransferase involved in cell wall biosynthesis
MSAFDVLCLPSQWEGLGLVLLEAMLRRVAIVGSSAGAIPEVLGGGKFGYLFRAGDAGSLANALTLAHDDVQGRKALAERAYHHARESFSVDEMVRRTIAVYEETSARCAGGHGRMG